MLWRILHLQPLAIIQERQLLILSPNCRYQKTLRVHFYRLLAFLSVASLFLVHTNGVYDLSSPN